MIYMAVELEKLVKIADALSRHPESINMNSVSKESNVSVASTYRILKAMEKRNEALKEKRGNNVFYRLNLMNSFAKKYAEMASIRRRERFFLKKPEYYDLLMNLKNSVKEFSLVVGIFGSMSRMEKKPADIDFLIVYKSDVKPIQAAIRKQDIRISPFYITEEELEKKAKDKVIMNIIRDAVILYGESEFWGILSEAA